LKLKNVLELKYAYIVICAYVQHDMVLIFMKVLKPFNHIQFLQIINTYHVMFFIFD